MKHLFSWVLVIMLCSLAMVQFEYIKQLKQIQQDIVLLRTGPTIINVPEYDGMKETLKSYIAFTVSHAEEEVPVVIPIFISEDHYTEWKNRIRQQYIAYQESRKQ